MTTIDQSNRLLSAGVKRESASHHWQKSSSFAIVVIGKPNESELPVWTLEDLIALMPTDIGQFAQVSRKWKVPRKWHDPELGRARYEFAYKSRDEALCLKAFNDKDIMEGATQMVVWLAEGGYI